LLTPRPYQTRILDQLRRWKRVSNLSDPGTGKTFETGLYLLDQGEHPVILAAPDTVIPDWCEMFRDTWPDHNWVDCRSGKKGVKELLKLLGGTTPAGRHIFATTSDLLRSKLEIRGEAHSRVDWATINRLRGLALVVDECHLVTRPESTRGRVLRALAGRCDVVAALTGTPIGRDKHARAWGHTQLVAPWILDHYGVRDYRGFKIRYCECEDTSGRVVPGGPIVRWVDEERVKRELLEPQAAYTAYVSKAEALPDLPPQIFYRRYTSLRGEPKRIYDQMEKELRVVLADTVLKTPGVAVAMARCLEIASGWVEGRVVHLGKMELLRDCLEEFGDEPKSLWCTRTRTLLSAALVAAGRSPEEAMRQVAGVPAVGTTNTEEREEGELGTSVDASSPEYRQVIRDAWRAGVGILHGATSSAGRERILADWKEGRIRTCVLHPNVGGAGLNLQHVALSMYVEQCPGSIQRTQSLARHHRSGQTRPVVTVDLLVEGTIEGRVLKAHEGEREGEVELMEYFRGE